MKPNHNTFQPLHLMNLMKKKLEKSKKAEIIKKISSYLHQKYEEIIICYLFGSFMTEESFADIEPYLAELTSRRAEGTDAIHRWILDASALMEGPLVFLSKCNSEWEGNRRQGSKLQG